jgi:Flp pilus assembly protein TadD
MGIYSPAIHSKRRAPAAVRRLGEVPEMSASAAAASRGRGRIRAAGLVLTVAFGWAPAAAAQEREPRTEVRVDRPAPIVGGDFGAVPGGPVGTVSLAYRSALGDLGGGSPGAALDAIVALEKEVAATDPAALAKVATREQLRVIAELARLDPEALLPVVLLHYHLLRSYAARRSYPSASHHAEVFRGAAELYAERVGTPAARQTAGVVLAALGAELLGMRLRADARLSLQRALAFDPDNPGTLLVLGKERERDGAYDEAVGYFERLAAVLPDSPEGRLRLAVNLRRVGRERDAAERFTALVRAPDGGPDAHPDLRWAAQLAYQELARLRLAHDDAGGAVALLREATERFPDSEVLRLELAFAIDRGGDPRGARAVVDALAGAPAGGGESPRLRYNRDTEAGVLLEALAGVEDRAAGLRLSLAVALERLAVEEAGG